MQLPTKTFVKKSDFASKIDGMTHINRLFILGALATTSANVCAQNETTGKQLDSLFIAEVEDNREPDKVLHAEPLYIDLIRDLGARKGEREWNAGLGLTDRNQFDEYLALVEYEWAPIDRLGLEVELPFTLYYPTVSNESAPSNRLNSLKLAGQYSFYVSELKSISLALGYIHEFELMEFDRWSEGEWYKGMVYNPFLVAGKRFGSQWHSLIYTGPVFHGENGQLKTAFDVNLSAHYMVSGTRNFIGVELNQTTEGSDYDLTIRPQMRLSINEHLMVGIVVGIPVNRESERMSSFLRLIYEPAHR